MNPSNVANSIPTCKECGHLHNNNVVDKSCTQCDCSEGCGCGG
jgi:hypothetical protein